jgi:hypothetical protein
MSSPFASSTACFLLAVRLPFAAFAGNWLVSGGQDLAPSAEETVLPGTRGPRLFPFVLPWDDATPSVANLSGWLHKPAGKFGHIRTGDDGHLYAGKDRIRFFGVDLAFSANFPRKDDAGKIAARTAKFGINIVRTGMGPEPEGAGVVTLNTPRSNLGIAKGRGSSGHLSV